MLKEKGVSNMKEEELQPDDIVIEDNSNQKQKAGGLPEKNVQIKKGQEEEQNDNTINEPHKINLEIEEDARIQNKPGNLMEKKFQVPSNLKKTFICSLVLFIIGIVLIILGSIEDIRAADPGKGITFWTLGSIVLIPGGYYSYQFYKAKKAKDEYERDEILDQIPEL